MSQTLDEAGVKLSAGESIEYIITDASGKKDPQKARPLALYALDDGYDPKKYADLIFEAAETLLQPFGYTAEKLRDELTPSDKKRSRNNKEAAARRTAMKQSQRTLQMSFF